ncbi:uncharacterized protein DS421_12g374480 [Arachis hypogaea]|nr:uncharacterized protein DS421_12g374480 [Arachis hypogaea]
MNLLWNFQSEDFHHTRDDLILFVQANKEQILVIKEALSKFRKSSGQKVSFQKSCVYFSRNVHHSIHQEINGHLSINLTKNLGKYFGVPLMHERCNKQQFQFIIDKMTNKLSSWNMKSLSLTQESVVSSFFYPYACDINYEDPKGNL